MPEIALKILNGDHRLEASHDERKGSYTAVICHPHPLYGGDMENNVVVALRNVFGHSGCGTLRFNFRGVGESGGEYGEGEGEVEDLLAVFNYLSTRSTNAILLAGYSFGAWIAVKGLAKGLHPAGLILVSPPLDFLDFENLRIPDQPCLITLGDRDAYCARKSLDGWLSRQRTDRVRLEMLAGCDHFYSKREKALEKIVSVFVRALFPCRPA